MSKESRIRSTLIGLYTHRPYQDTSLTTASSHVMQMIKVEKNKFHNTFRTAMSLFKSIQVIVLYSILKRVKTNKSVVQWFIYTPADDTIEPADLILPDLYYKIFKTCQETTANRNTYMPYTNYENTTTISINLQPFQNAVLSTNYYTILRPGVCIHRSRRRTVLKTTRTTLRATGDNLSIGLTS